MTTNSTVNDITLCEYNIYSYFSSGRTIVELAFVHPKMMDVITA